MKKLIAAAICMLFSCLAAVFMAGCSDKTMMDEAHFSFDATAENFNPPRVTFIDSADDFADFLADETIFNTEFSEEFSQTNARYDEQFFEEHDLIALILQANSSMVKGYCLDKMYKDGSEWVLEVSSVTDRKDATDDMGRYFCYYIEADEDGDITGARLA